MRPIELIPETIDVTNNGPETLRLPFGVKILPGATATVNLFKYTGGPSPTSGVNAGGTSNDPGKLDPQTPVGTVVGSPDPGYTVGLPIGGGGPRAGYTAGIPSSANAGPVHISGDSPRQRLWNAICASVQDGLASGKFVSAMAVAAGGTNYQLGDHLTVVGGVGTIAATATVATLTGPGPAPVATVTLVLAGSYSTVPASPAATTTDSVAGANCTLTLTTVARVVTLSNQTVGSGQPNLAVGNAGGYYGNDLDYETPWQKRTQAVDTGVRSVNGTVGFNAAPRGGAAVVGIIPR